MLEPLCLNLRHRFRVIAVVQETPDMISIYIGGRRLDRLEADAGQYLRWRFLTRGNWWQAHPFSLTAAPNDAWLRLTVKVVGDHTRNLRHLKPGDRVYGDGPSGAFTADHRVGPGALLIAGGSGIAPVRALLGDLPAGTIVLYRASTAADLVFREELDRLAVEKRARVCYVLGARDDPGPRRLFTPAGLRGLVPDVRRRDAYLCGPDGLRSARSTSTRSSSELGGCRACSADPREVLDACAQHGGTPPTPSRRGGAPRWRPACCLHRLVPGATSV